MEMMAWDVDPGEWRERLEARRAFLTRTHDGEDEQSLAHAEYLRQRSEVARLETPPRRVVFTTTGFLFGEKARLWRSTWWHLSHMRIECAGWEVLRLKWQHVWGIAARELVVLLPAGAIPHVSDMAETLLARNPFQATIEVVVEPGHEP